MKNENATYKTKSSSNTNNNFPIINPNNNLNNQNTNSFLNINNSFNSQSSNINLITSQNKSKNKYKGLNLANKTKNIGNKNYTLDDCTFTNLNNNDLFPITKDNSYASKLMDISNFEYGTLDGIKNSFANFSYKFPYSHVLPVIYFFISILTLMILILINFYKENIFHLDFFHFLKNQENQKNYLKQIKEVNSYFYPLPNFYKLKCVQPIFYSIAIGLLSLSGILNVWFYCSMFLQRFSVPEFCNEKIMIHFMFILGIISNILLIFLGFSPDIFIKDSIDFKQIKINFNSIIYLIFIFFNILFSIIGLKNLIVLKKQILCEDEWFNRKLRIKKSLLYMILFILLIYILAICIKNNQIKININFSQKIFIGNKNSNEKSWTLITLIYYIILCFSPYLLFVLNAFLNLGYYSDIIFLQKKLNTIIDKEYFYNNNDESTFLLNN
jgi:hypothetical protein